MSGLCGGIQFDRRPLPEALLSRMARAAAHRGPDGIQHWQADGVGLTHLALHVTKYDRDDVQPVVADNLVLVADARIDNRSEVRKAVRPYLQSDTPTDAALILGAYRRWGVECPAHLLGDFAFAIWNARERQLFAARDPMAMRAFHYCAESDRFLFATEIKQLLAAPGVSGRLREASIAAHLAGNFNGLERTVYEDVQALAPAHALIATDSSVHTWRYWDLDPDARITYDDERDYLDHFRSLFAEAVQARIQSTYPVGVFLSGGLDSGSVAAMAGSLRERGFSGVPALRSYSWASQAFPECDERAISDAIVQRYNLADTDVNADGIPLLSQSPYIGPDRDSPFVGGFHGLTEQALSIAKADGVRTMMSGHRGDLLVGGWIFDYLHLFRTGRWGQMWRELKRAEKKTGVSWRRAMLLYLWYPLRAVLGRRGYPNVLRGPIQSLSRSLGPAGDSSSPFPAWIRPDYAAQYRELPQLQEAPNGLVDPMRRWRYESIFTPSHMRVATLFERNGARHGITMTDPWSDRRLVEFAAAVPPGVLCRNGENKWITRDALREIIPEEARRGLRKIDPYPLYEHALKVDLRSLIEELYCDRSRSQEKGHPRIDVDALCTYLENYGAGGAEDPRVWYTITFGMWLQHHHSPPSHSISESLP